MSRRDNISRNAGIQWRWLAKAFDTEDDVSIAERAVTIATVIEDAVDAAENARQDALHTANEAKRS